MKTIIALLILVSTVAYGQVDSVAFYKLDIPKGMNEYFQRSTENPSKHLHVSDLGVSYSLINSNPGVQNNVNEINFFFNEFKRILDANGITTDQLISYVPIYYDADGRYYPFTAEGLIKGYKKESSNTGKFGFTFQDGMWKYIIAIDQDGIHLTVLTFDSYRVKAYLEVLPTFND